MITLLKDITPYYSEKAMGGEGRVEFHRPFTMEELGGRFCNLTRATLRPGDSVGSHSGRICRFHSRCLLYSG